MGRRAVAAVTADSSPSSGESSFRELDDVFLQVPFEFIFSCIRLIDRILM